MQEHPNNFDSMMFLITHPHYLLVLIPFILVISNWQWAALIYYDSKKRGIHNKWIWTLLTLFTPGPTIMTVYKAWTKRPQTALSLSPLGLVAGERLEKMGVMGKTLLIVLFVGWIGLAVLSIMGEKNIDTMSLILYGILTPLVLIAYTLFSIRSKQKMNPLDKPLWGMGVTPEGLIDESLTKHKRWVVILVSFILSIPILFIIYVFIAIKLGY